MSDNTGRDKMQHGTMYYILLGGVDRTIQRPFIKSHKISQKPGNSMAWTNSATQLEIRRPAENCGPYSCVLQHFYWWHRCSHTSA